MHLLIQPHHLKGFTWLIAKFLFQISWRSSKIIFINKSNTLMGLGRKLLNSSIMMTCLIWAQSYQWYTSLRTTYLLPKLRYRVSIITLTKCQYPYMFCIHVQAIIDDKDRSLQSHKVIKEYNFYVSDDHNHDTLFGENCFGLIYDSFKKNRVSLQNIGFGQMGV